MKTITSSSHVSPHVVTSTSREFDQYQILPNNSKMKLVKIIVTFIPSIEFGCGWKAMKMKNHRRTLGSRENSHLAAPLLLHQLMIKAHGSPFMS